MGEQNVHGSSRKFARTPRGGTCNDKTISKIEGGGRGLRVLGNVNYSIIPLWRHLGEFVRVLFCVLLPTLGPDGTPLHSFITSVALVFLPPSSPGLCRRARFSPDRHVVRGPVCLRGSRLTVGLSAGRKAPPCSWCGGEVRQHFCRVSLRERFPLVVCVEAGEITF